MNNTETNPLISVIIPTFNRADLIGRAIHSVLRQTYTDFEILISDDASTDDTSRVVTSFNDRRIRYLHSEVNAGASAARNKGIHAANGEFVAFLDSDDIWMPKKLESQLTALRRCVDPHAVVSYTQVIVDSGIMQKLMPMRAMRDTEPVADYVLGDEGLIHTSSLMLSSRLARSTCFPIGQKKHEDWDLFLRLEKKNVIWQFLDDPLAVWHNETRHDRLTNLSYQMSLEWLREHESLLTKRAKRGFMFKEVAMPLIQSEERRVYALCLVLGAVMYGAVGPRHGIKTIGRVAISKRLRARAKRLLKGSA